MTRARLQERATDTAPEPARPAAFISYAREQKEFVISLEERLRAQGKTVWVDWKDIKPTADWRAKVRAGIEESGAFIFVLSPDSLASEICEEERLHAVGNNKRIVPIVRVEVDPKGVIDELARPNWIYFRQQDDFDDAVCTLVDALDADLEWLDGHARLLVRANEWSAQRRDGSLLLRGRDLAAAERWIAQEADHRERATSLQREYVSASRHAASRRRTLFLGSGALAVVVALVLGVVGWQQRELARSRSLAATAVAEIPVDPWRALELAVSAREVAETREAVAAIRGALSAPRESAVLTDPDGTIHSAHFTADSQNVLTTSYDGTVRQWSVDNGGGEVVERVAPGPNQTGQATDVSPDGRLVVMALGGGVVRGGEEDALRNAAPGGGVVRVAAANSEEPLLTRPAFIERANLGEGMEGLAPAVEFSPDGRHFLAVGYDGSARVWPLGVTFLDDNAILDVAITPDGRRCATANSSGTVTIWSCADGTRLTMWSLDPSKSNEATFAPSDIRVSFSEDGSQLFVSAGLPWASTSVWHVDTGRKVAEVAWEGTSPASLNRDGTLVLTERSTKEAEIADVPTGQRKTTLGGLSVGVGMGLFSEDDTVLVTSNRDEAFVRIWDVAAGKTVHTIGEFESPVEDVDITASGDLVAVASGTTPHVWDSSTGELVSELRGHSDGVYGVRFAPGAEFVVTASGDGTVRVWETRTGREVIARRVDNDAALKTSVSRDGLIVSVGIDGSAAVFRCAACHMGNQLVQVAHATLSDRPK